VGIRRLTVGQAIVEFLIAQESERDGVALPFFEGVFGIFGHGNVAGLGEALFAARDRIRFYLPRNEQAMVHSAAAFAKMRNRLQTFACTSSIGPGATNMLTAAAGATINRLPLLLLPGDIFATRRAAPVLQQLESSASPDVSVNDCFKPARAAWTVAPRSDAGADLAVRDRHRHARAAAGRTGRCVRFPRRAVRTAHVAHPQTACRQRPARGGGGAAEAVAVAVHRGRWRRPLQ
jgi:Thiamine pyrophosphate enzyme, N-terminal TPP binding domain